MLLNILITLAIIWLTFSIIVATISLWFTFRHVLPFLVAWDDSDADTKCQLTQNDLPEWTIGDDDIPF